MKKTRPGIPRGAEKCVREISQLLNAIGCKLKKVFANQYQVMDGRQDTGLVLTFGKEIISNKTCQSVWAVMHFPVPSNDHRFLLNYGPEEAEALPHLRACLSDKIEKTLLWEFICRSLYFFRTTKILRQWHCHNCGETGFEIFLDNGSVGTFDFNCNEFSLIIINKNNDISGSVFDNLIGENVLPVCAVCRDKLGYEENEDCALTGDKSYFRRLLFRRSASARVMGIAIP